MDWEEAKKMRDLEQKLAAAQAEARELRFRNDELEATLQSELKRLRSSCDEARELREMLERSERNYLSAVNGRRDFRNALRNTQAELARVREALSDLYHQHKCGCEHPACRSCGRDRDAEAALSQPAEKTDLPLIARRQPWPAKYTGAAIIGGGIVPLTCLGSADFRIADTDEHGLPVIERTAEMPQGATHKITWLDDGEVELTDSTPIALEANRSGGMSERIEDYNAHAEPEQENNHAE